MAADPAAIFRYLHTLPAGGDNDPEPQVRYPAPPWNRQALLRFGWARGQVRLVPLALALGLAPKAETCLDAWCQRTPCGQSGDVASDRGDKLGTTLMYVSALARSVPRVVPSVPPLIPPLPTLRRARPAAGPGRLRRNNSWFFAVGMATGWCPTHTKRNKAKIYFNRRRLFH